MPEELLSSPILFSESFQLVDKHGVVHNFGFSGTVEQKPQIVKLCADAVKGALAKGWTVQHAPAAPAPSDPNSSTEIIMAETLEVTHDKKGKHFSVKGGKYTKFGLPIYPEYLEALGVSADMEPGEYAFKKKVKVQVIKNGEGKPSSKVIALA